MAIRVYNTLKRKKEDFKPAVEGRVHIYICGPTVYDYSHLGHARAYVAFDVIRRYLDYRGYKVLYVENVTDVDDKIINRAAETNQDALELSRRFAEEFDRDMKALGVKAPDVQPKVSEHISDIIDIVKGLIENGFAYEVDGDVYYRVLKFKKYTELSGLNIDELKAGARVDVDSRKESPLDFALWKKAKPGEVSWDSPWGKGRPGWHIECSAMSMKYLGATLDIHGGGRDLIFPHHTNEIAQSEAYTGKKFAKYWMHNGFVTIDKEKMSKSLGNFFTIREILKKYSPDVVRFFLLSTHYRSPIDFSDEHLKQAKIKLERLYNTLEAIDSALKIKKPRNLSEEDKKIITQIEVHRKKFTDSMDDDFNTTEAIAALFELARTINKYIETGKNPKVLQIGLDVFQEIDKVFNLFQLQEREIPKGADKAVEEMLKELKAAKMPETFEGKMEKLITMREEARKAKDFETSDKIRARLSEAGIVLEDQAEGVKWKLR